jgi:protease IV
MKQFTKFLFASCLGTFLALIAIALFGVGLIGSAMKSLSKQESVKANTILTIKFDKNIPERTNNQPVSFSEFATEENTGLIDMINAIERAKEDDNIKGIFLETSQPALNLASIATVRKALIDFKESGKFIVAFGDYYTEMGYYLSSVADKIYLNPIGEVEFNGLIAQVPFFKNMLDKIGVKYEVFYAGKFKSATEPYRLANMSEENRTQIREFIHEIYGNYLKDISETRNIPIAELNKISNNMLVRNAKDAVKYKLVDGTMYKDQILDDLKERLGLDKKEDISSIDLEDYTRRTRPKDAFKKNRDKIAVIYAEGTILDGSDEPGCVDGDAYSKMIRQIRQDKDVKAIVLRVNSPGGSALASEKIWRELSLAKEAGIPIVVSMGDYAASGGYYIACMADSILAEENTLTGSIGVFSMFPNAQGLMNDKLGINFDTVKTGNYSLGLSPFVELSEQEKAMMQTSTNEFYDTFLERVAVGRKMKKDAVNEVAQGRVWTGSKAKTIGLVDAIGGLEDAIAIAKNMAGLNGYKLSEYPKMKEPIEQLIDQYTGKKSVSHRTAIQKELGDLYPYYEYMADLKKLQGVQARMPFQIEIK